MTCYFSVSPMTLFSSLTQYSQSSCSHTARYPSLTSWFTQLNHKDNNKCPFIQMPWKNFAFHKVHKLHKTELCQRIDLIKINVHVFPYNSNRWILFLKCRYKKKFLFTKLYIGKKYKQTLLINSKRSFSSQKKLSNKSLYLCLKAINLAENNHKLHIIRETIMREKKWRAKCYISCRNTKPHTTWHVETQSHTLRGMSKHEATHYVACRNTKPCNMWHVKTQSHTLHIQGMLNNKATHYVACRNKATHYVACQNTKPCNMWHVKTNPRTTWHVKTRSHALCGMPKYKTMN